VIVVTARADRRRELVEKAIGKLAEERVLQNLRRLVLREAVPLDLTRFGGQFLTSLSVL
jgi:hypothetical protein